jgi:hypothetical protein
MDDWKLRLECHLSADCQRVSAPDKRKSAAVLRKPLTGTAKRIPNAYNASPALQRRHPHTHGVQEHAAHLASFLVAGLGWKEAGEAALERVGGHLLGITEVPELAVSETMNGQEVCDIALRRLPKQPET